MTDTQLDAAYAAMAAAPGDDAARLRYYQCLADSELFLLLAADAADGVVAPRLFDLEDGPMVLAFDSEERLAEFGAGPLPYAALPGRVIAAQLAGHGIGLGVNLGTGEAAFLVPPEALDWLTGMLERAPAPAEARPAGFRAPGGLPEVLRRVLAEKLVRAGGLAAGAVLAAVDYDDGRRGHMLAFLDAGEGAEPALARAASEALAFSGIEAGELDVAFLAAGDPAAQAMLRCGLRLDMAAAPPGSLPATPRPPGMDPARPPKLK